MILILLNAHSCQFVVMNRFARVALLVSSKHSQQDSPMTMGTDKSKHSERVKEGVWPPFQYVEIDEIGLKYPKNNQRRGKHIVVVLQTLFCLETVFFFCHWMMIVMFVFPYAMLSLYTITLWQLKMFFKQQGDEHYWSTIIRIHKRYL